MHCDVGARNARGARAAVGLDHIAIDLQRTLAHFLEIDRCAQRAADQALDLLRAPRLLAARRFTAAARVGCTRQHAVFGGKPATPLALQKRRYLIPDAKGTDYLCITALDQNPTF